MRVDDGGDCGGEGGAWLGAGEEGRQDFGRGGFFCGRNGARGGGLEMERGFLGDGHVVVGGLDGGLGGWFAVSCCAGNALEEAAEGPWWGVCYDGLWELVEVVGVVE